MHVSDEMGSALTRLPASDAPGAPHAGLTFAMMRSTEGFGPGVEPLPHVAGPLADIEAHHDDLQLPPGEGARIRAQLEASRQQLEGLTNSMP